VILETSAAVNRTVVSRLERDFGGCAALRADCVKHFAVGVTGGFAARPALFATDGLILEALLSIELLLAGRENEFLTAILAYQCLVFEHLDFFPFSVLDFFDTRASADLVFAPTLANRKIRYPALRLSLTLLSEQLSRLDLHLDRTMLTNKLFAYVDRFACDWLRFSTTDPIHGHQNNYRARHMVIANIFYI